MISANKIYKESGSSLPFKDWLEREKNKGKFIPNAQALKEFKEVEDFVLGQLEGCSDFNKFKTYVNNINFTLEQLHD